MCISLMCGWYEWYVCIYIYSRTCVFDLCVCVFYLCAADMNHMNHYSDDSYCGWYEYTSLMSFVLAAETFMLLMLWMGDVTRIYLWVMSHIWIHISHVVRISRWNIHVAHVMNGWCHPYIYESCHTYSDDSHCGWYEYISICHLY